MVTSPQRFLYFTGALLVAAGLVHLGVFLVDGGPWGGPVSWRKPVTFGLSFGLTALAVAWIAGFLDLGRRAGWVLLGGLAGASALEVAWVTLQAWRDVPAHFAEDAVGEALFIAAGVSIAAVSAVLVAVTVLAFRRPIAPAGMALAIRVGLMLLLVGQGLGGAIIANGEAIDRPPTDVDLAVFGAAGAMKVPHAVAMHAVQVLPLLAWLLASTTMPERRRFQVVVAGALGYGALVAASAAQTFAGRSPLDLSLLGALLGMAGLSILAASFTVTVVGLVRQPALASEGSSASAG